jgi:hypothetical protein
MVQRLPLVAANRPFVGLSAAGDRILEPHHMKISFPSQ